MAPDPAPQHVTSISGERLGEAGNVLARAFEDDPLMRYLLQAQGETYECQLQELVHFTCEIRFALDWPVLAVERDARIAGVACMTPPESREWPLPLIEAQARFRSLIGPKASTRLERYGAVVEARKPREPLYVPGAIGVAPSGQGEGHGRRVLDAAHQLSEAHPDSTGVSPDTENPSNVPMYEHFGYRVVAQEQVEQITVWCVFRPNARGG